MQVFKSPFLPQNEQQSNEALLFHLLYCSFFHIIQFRSFLPFYLLSLVVIFHSFLRVSLLYIRLCVFDSSPLSDIPWSSRTPGDILRIPSVALKTYCRNGTLLKIINIKISFWECFCINKKKILINRLCSTLKSLFLVHLSKIEVVNIQYSLYILFFCFLTYFIICCRYSKYLFLFLHWLPTIWQSSLCPSFQCPLWQSLEQ